MNLVTPRDRALAVEAFERYAGGRGVTDHAVQADSYRADLWISIGELAVLLARARQPRSAVGLPSTAGLVPTLHLPPVTVDPRAAFEASKRHGGSRGKITWTDVRLANLYSTFPPGKWPVARWVSLHDGHPGNIGDRSKNEIGRTRFEPSRETVDFDPMTGEHTVTHVALLDELACVVDWTEVCAPRDGLSVTEMAILDVAAQTFGADPPSRVERRGPGRLELVLGRAVTASELRAFEVAAMPHIPAFCELSVTFTLARPDAY